MDSITNVMLRAFLASFPDIILGTFYEIPALTGNFFEAMQTLKVKLVAFGYISMTQYMFSKICAFTHNANFRMVSFTLDTNSEMSLRGSESCKDNAKVRFWSMDLVYTKREMEISIHRLSVKEAG
ncbi:hypothetical protein L596_029847 [Steinernema carpocapsae]|uniref:Uncharacterized protein n=1 Tax=Steinernema carpocapsae TaxID=34508 RepID=A0A4U5LQZ5_STECR|nr:hypothetical protein L596_029847 [Steinernema carpocapsae]